jgi:hypothetical protein
MERSLCGGRPCRLRRLQYPLHEGLTGPFTTFLDLSGSVLPVRWFSSEPDSHDDFKPQMKAAPAGSVDATIEQDISSHDVFIYMKV